MTETQKKRHSPLTWVPSAYFAMGMPFVILNMVCVLMFKGLGIEDSQIALWTSVIMFPWTIKFLWSPFLEIFKTKKFFVVTTQLISGVGFGLVALALHLDHFFAISIAILAVIALSGATHDIALDGLYMAELSKTDQAKYIGWQGAFYNLAKLIATGLLVYIAGVLINHYEASGATNQEAALPAWTVIMLACCAILVLLSIWHRIILPSSQKENTAAVRSSSEIMKELGEVIRDFFTKKHIWLYIAFIILYRLGEGFVIKIVPLFLKADRAVGGLGLSEQQIGVYYGSFGAAAFVIGSLLAGYYIAHLGLKKALFSLVCIFNIPFLVYTFLAWMQPESIWLIGGGIVLEYFGYGFGFVGLTLFMMQQVAPGKHQMAHYAFASGIMNLSVMVTGAVSGFLSDAFGYKIFFAVVMIAVIPVFIMTKFLPFTYPDNAAKESK
ncbi:MAG: MFS transporter [Bacteroidetes bacterium]|uniref:MFS transporter n=1 Tax=Candidatus Cryptobacteroides gallistercoris TaxID=2840765 RepID=A0A940DQC2_9BACT|nr:MFS transporter [Candidatus Cryptobacteroides gallistercoris]